MADLVTALVSLALLAFAVPLVLALRDGNTAATTNVLAAAGAAAVSLYVATGLRPPWEHAILEPALPLWVALAGLLHAVGMLGAYESVWWWDHLTHTVSGTLVAALLYAGVLVAGVPGVTFDPSATVVAAATVALTLAVGVAWELVELVARAVGEHLDVEPVLVHYGWRDTAFDVLFDLVGAVLVLGVDLRLFVDLASLFPAATATLLDATVLVVMAGSGLVVVLLAASPHHEDWGR